MSQVQRDARDQAVWEAMAWLAEWRQSADPKDLQMAASRLGAAAQHAEWAAQQSVNR